MKRCVTTASKKAIEGPNPAWQRHKPVRKLSHQCLTLMHRPDDMQISQSAMAELALHQGTRDDAAHLAARLEHRIGDCAHQAHRTTAVDQADICRSKRFTH